MLPEPLHPAVVHFPIVLTFLLPISVVAALWVIGKAATPRRAWSVPVALAAALWLSAFVATRTGEQEEERVEPVVAESAIHGHEEAAERFLVLSGVLVLVAAAGLLPATLGRAARLVTAAGSLGLVAAAAQVGRSGGELVYRHGAASAYAGDSGVKVARAGDDPDDRSEGPGEERRRRGREDDR